MASALALLLALAAPAPDPIALDGLIGFSEPAKCEPAPAFRHMLDSLLAAGSPTLRPAAFEVPPAYKSAFGDITRLIANNGRMIVGIASTGTWHGLPLLGVDLELPPDATGPILHLHFRAPMVQTGAVLSGMGLLGQGRVARLETTSIGTQMICEPHG